MKKATTIAVKPMAGASAPAKRARRSSDETRQDILAMADQLFRDKGFANVSIADIANALSMSPANVFKHFRTKIDLVDEIVQRLVQNIAVTITILGPSYQPIDRIRDFTHRLMEKHHHDFKTNPYIFELLLLTAQRDLQCGQYYKSVISGLMARIICDAAKSGVYHSRNPESDAEIVLQMFTGVLHPIVFTNTDIEKLRLCCDEIVCFIDRAFKNPLEK